MTAGKSKRVPKGAKKKKWVDPYKTKEWYTVQAPSYFKKTEVCKTPVNKSAGMRTAAGSLKGRVFEINCADLEDESHAHRVMRLRVEEVHGAQALTGFFGMRFTTDKLGNMIKKWHTIIRAETDVTTQDGYVIRMFAIGLTKRRQLQQKKTTYAQTQQIKRIQARMRSIMEKSASKSDTKKLTQILLNGLIGKEMGTQCASVFPLSDALYTK
eukprot:CAMPEP_0117428454 /NCGR_PEP_ID=MMETSP0758-20121206/8155_1 /TAXON_ID=63605 /ORGANISM="Percolomonas cosmopolitus, Strain AE-1 (ATCC 50343)" /LENGTH=211 /DNA_ID=CAMNT_0005214813 /DNA_START=30 /DNA_END=666 /DNA_ORIENTATION=-